MCKPGIRKLRYGRGELQALEGPVACLGWQREWTGGGQKRGEAPTQTAGPRGRGCLLNSNGIILLGRWLIAHFLTKGSLETVYFFNKSLNEQNKTLPGVNFPASVHKLQVCPGKNPANPSWPLRCAYVGHRTDSLPTVPLNAEHLWADPGDSSVCKQHPNLFEQLPKWKTIHKHLSKDP